MFPSNAMAAARSRASLSLTWNITNLPQSTPHAPCTAQLACSCPGGETPQALIASRIESKLFPRGQGPSYSGWDLPFLLHPPLQLFRGLNLNVHAFSGLLRTLISLPQRIGPAFSTSLNHTRHSQPHVGAFFPLLKYSWTPMTPDRTTVSFLRALKSGLCPLLFSMLVMDTHALFSLCEPLEIWM